MVIPMLWTALVCVSLVEAPHIALRSEAVDVPKPLPKYEKLEFDRIREKANGEWLINYDNSCMSRLMSFFGRNKSYWPKLSRFGMWAVNSASYNQEATKLMTFHFLFSASAFIVDNPSKVNDSIEIDLAGLDGLLNAYTALVATDSKKATPNMVRVLELKRAGKLRELVQELSTKFASMPASS